MSNANNSLVAEFMDVMNLALFRMRQPLDSWVPTC